MDEKAFKSHVNFEVLAKLFFDIAEERYPSAEKMKQLVAKIVAPLAQDEIETLFLKISILNAMRDMIKEVSPNQLYRNLDHRDNLYMGIIEALEDLEDELEELQEEEYEDED